MNIIGTALSGTRADMMRSDACATDLVASAPAAPDMELTDELLGQIVAALGPKANGAVIGTADETLLQTMLDRWA